MKKVVIAVLFAILASTTLSAQEKDRLCEMKSCIVTMTSELMDQELITTRYIDDYGDRIAEYTTIPIYMGGERKDSLLVGQIKNGDNIVVVDYIHKTMTAAGDDSRPIHFLNLTEDVIKKYRITRLGEEDVCGKPCVKYSCLIKGQGIRTKVQVWVWRGVSLKKKVFTLPLNMEYEAIDVQEDVPIDPSVFVVPDYPLNQGSQKN